MNYPNCKASITGVASRRFLFFVLLVVLSSLSCQPIISLGRNPKGAELERIETLPNYHDGEFHNLFAPPSSPAPVTGNSRRSRLGMLKYFFGKPDSTKPSRRMPVVITDLINTTWDKPTVIWFGHSSFLIKSKAGNLLFDPNFSGYAGPFPGLVDAFKGADAYGVDQMPPLEAIIISHDHYDHLDYATVKLLKKKAKRLIVPVGVGSHLRRWGFNDDQIREMFWNDSLTISPALKITATPAHHRSNRTFEQRKTLWASYVIELQGYKIYFSGDTGYSPHFSLIGKQYGPFDLVMMECGQYNQRWSQSHMHPTQTAQAAVDLGAKMVVPIHWGKFAESMHRWNEPVELLSAAAKERQLPLSIPQIGQPYTIGAPPLTSRWWDFE